MFQICGAYVSVSEGGFGGPSPPPGSTGGLGGWGVGAAHGSTKVDGGTKTTVTRAAEVFRRDGSLDGLSYPILKAMFYDSDKSARNSRLKFKNFFDLVIEKYWEGFCSERLVVMSLLLLLLQH